ncbi:hypothetical protein [Anaerovorax odorimutans]|uniref:hypothetical protein n=1 Tax=Anaerovorax odorimutans TaxID=109327 RepID=UPI00042621C0|nr:hypothetical protein [Anaerovorax odorimutans]
MKVTQDILLKTMNHLNDKDVRILLLSYYYLLSVEEISNTLYYDIEKVKQWKKSAVTKLLFELPDYTLKDLELSLTAINLDKLKFFKKLNNKI